MRRNPVFLWAIALLAMALFARLGFWQLERADEKRQMLANAAAALSSRVPKPLSVISDATRADGYDWIEIEGRFADAPAVLLDNQQKNGVVGVRAYRVFSMDDGQPLLVEMGWAALPGDRTMPAVSLGTAPRSMAGLLMPPPGKGLDVGSPAVLADGTLLATTLDLPYLAASLKAPRLAPRVLRPASAPDPGFVLDFDILPNTLPPERHLGYAVQWLGLAATVLITALLLTWRARRTARRAARRNEGPLS